MNRVRFMAIGGALLGAAVALQAATPAGRAHDGPHTHRVLIEDFAFVPAELTVRAGDIVEWVNADLAPHTATSDYWDTGALESGQVGAVVIETAGVIAYLCAYHPHMRGTIAVEE